MTHESESELSKIIKENTSFPSHPSRQYLYSLIFKNSQKAHNIHIAYVHTSPALAFACQYWPENASFYIYISLIDQDRDVYGRHKGPPRVFLDGIVQMKSQQINIFLLSSLT